MFGVFGDCFVNQFSLSVQSVDCLERRVFGTACLVFSNVMPGNCLLRRLLYGELSLGQRPADRPKKRFMDRMRAILLKCSIKTSDWKLLQMTEIHGR